MVLCLLFVGLLIICLDCIGLVGVIVFVLDFTMVLFIYGCVAFWFVLFELWICALWCLIVVVFICILLLCYY